MHNDNVFYPTNLHIVEINMIGNTPPPQTPIKNYN